VRLAVQEDMLDGTTVDERFNAAEGLSLDGIELWSGGLAERVDKIRGLSRLMGIRVPVVSAAMRASVLAGDEDEQRYATAELRRLLELCAKIGATGLVYVPAYGGPRTAHHTPSDEARREALKLLPERLREIGRAAAQQNVRLLLEPVNRFESFALVSVADAAAICREAGPEGLGICANLYHMRVQDEEVVPACTVAGDLLRHVHVSDSGRRLPRADSIVLGAELRALRQAGYDGYIGLESNVPGQNAALRRYFARELESALERLRGMVEAGT
jgi:sugar phosphate isomerase/epimerase